MPPQLNGTAKVMKGDTKSEKCLIKIKGAEFEK